MGNRRGRPRGAHQRCGICDRRRHARRHPAAEALAARAGPPDRRRRCDARRRLSDLATSAGVVVLGPLPQGLPALRVPIVTLDDLTPILMGGLAVALVSFADTSVLSRTYAARLRTPVDPNQEMSALGVANLAAGFFQGFPISSSSSRTPVAEAAGAKTQLTGVVGRARRRVAPAAGARAAPESPAGRPGRPRHRRRDRLDRSLRPSPHLSHPTLGVLALDRLLRGRRRAGRHSGHRARDRHCRDRVPLGRLAPALGRARPCRSRQGLSRHHAVSRRAADPRPRAVPLGCAAVLRQRRAVPRTRAGRRGELTDAGPLGRGRGRTGHQRRRHRSRRGRRAGRRPCTPQASSCASPR